jgi:SAM-dependent methyltransferase
MRFWRVATASDPQLAGRQSYELVRCEDCGTARTVLAQADGSMSALYEAGTYGEPHPAIDRLLEPLRTAAERDRMRFLRGVPAGARVVEVGAGDGSFVARLRAAGLDARGVEPSRRGVALAEARGAPVERAGLDDVSLEAGSIDTLIAWHVLEHLDDPNAALQRAGEWLQPAGRIVVACPNLNSLQARIGGDRWFHQDVPRHRTHFTADGLSRLVRRSGFRIERISHLLLEQNPLGMWQTLLNRVTNERDVAYRALKRDLGTGPTVRRDIALTTIVGLMLLPVAVGLELGAGAAGHGGSVVVVATRDPAAASNA